MTLTNVDPVTAAAMLWLPATSARADQHGGSEAGAAAALARRRCGAPSGRVVAGPRGRGLPRVPRQRRLVVPFYSPYYSFRRASALASGCRSASRPYPYYGYFGSYAYGSPYGYPTLTMGMAMDIRFGVWLPAPYPAPYSSNYPPSNYPPATTRRRTIRRTARPGRAYGRSTRRSVSVQAGGSTASAA